MSIVDVRVDRLKVKEEGLAEGPYVAEFYLRDEPGQTVTQVIGLPTEKIKNGEVVDFSDKSLKSKWVQVKEVSEEWIIGCRVRPMKDKSQPSDEDILTSAIDVGADVFGQTFDDLFPFQSFVLTNIVEFGGNILENIGMFDFMEKPFATGHAVLDEVATGGKRITSRVSFDLTADRQVRDDSTRSELDRPVTVVSGGENHGETIEPDKPNNLEPGDKNGFVELVIRETARGFFRQE